MQKFSTKIGIKGKSIKKSVPCEQVGLIQVCMDVQHLKNNECNSSHY